MGLMLTLGTIGGVGIATLGGALGSVGLATVALGIVEVVTMVVLVATVDEGRGAPRAARDLDAGRPVRLGARHPQAARRAVAPPRPPPLPGGVQRDAHRGRLFPALPRPLRRPMPTAPSSSATAIVGVSTALAALPGGRLSDRFGRTAGDLGRRGDRRERPGRRCRRAVPRRWRSPPGSRSGSGWASSCRPTGPSCRT